MRMILESPWHESYRQKDGFLPWSCHMTPDLPDDEKIYAPESSGLCAVKGDEFQASTLDADENGTVMYYLPIEVTHLSCRALIHRGPYEYPRMGSWLRILTFRDPREGWKTTVTRSHFVRGQEKAVADPKPFLVVHSKTMAEAIETHAKTYRRFYMSPKF